MRGDGEVFRRHFESVRSGRNLPKVKTHNRSLVFEVIRRFEPISRVEIAQATGLTRATITNIVNEFLAAGVVRESGEMAQEGTSGRRATSLTLNPGAFYVVGVEFTGSTVRLGVTNIKADALATRQVALPATFPIDVTDSLDLIAEGVRGLLDEVGRAGLPVAGIGVSIPGLIDSDRGVVVYAANLGWREVPLGALLRAKLGLPAFVERNTNVGVLAESWYGRQADASDLVYITRGQGVGVGIMTDRRIYRGSGSAGEVGHITVEPDGPLCRCGNRGCLEAVVSDSGVVSAALEARNRDASALKGLDLTAEPERVVEGIFALAEAGDQAAGAIVAHIQDLLGIAIANLMNLFNPQAVVLGPGFAKGGPGFVTAVSEIAGRRALPAIARQTVIVPSGFDENTVLVGATALVLDRIMKQASLAAVSADLQRRV